ncbi:uncharacterized protein LOC128985755 [Macrosteles quadrilineatus]|uniref:uncharacterized protein LOC128985755 n=1 Tax=Macrosteles quadrilineatus TaxID=74068 RepID=UPI0023E197D8|nr:uncharacterized protein LOC128985755 [Macrosteles quadrilineatus]XP_054261588.1 uncharacterized protein LOC128985755 [Macrosteles quadrilineatus]
MSSSGRDNRDSKRKYQWNPHNSGAKRFHGPSNNPREEFQRGVSSRWDRNHKTNDQGFQKNHRPPGNSWGNRERTNHIRFPTNNRNYSQGFDFQPSLSSRSSKDHEDVVGPGSDLERMEKVLATKKRIEEALASKSSSSNKEINFQNNLSNEDKSKDKESPGPNLDLRLTNSDFKEIGSVAPGVPTEGDLESNDFMNTNSPNTTTTHSIQQRSFDNTTSNLPANLQAKAQKVGGWSMTAVNNIVPESSKSSSPRLRNDIYIQEERERILGNVSTGIQESIHIDQQQQTTNKQSSDKQNSQNNIDEFSRVGQLYQSFLRSRLFGYTLRVRDKSTKPPIPNPLLDKTVLGNQNADNHVTEDQVIELQMPQPIIVKTERNLERNPNFTPEHIEAEEANEFCKDFGFLLKDPNFLIPPEDLEKLGLGHLREMNKLINEKRRGRTLQNYLETQENFYNMDSGILNSVAGNIMNVNTNNKTFPLNSPHNSGEREDFGRFNEADSLANHVASHFLPSSSLGSQTESRLEHTIQPDIHRNDNILFNQSPLLSSFQNISVEAVVEKVVKQILQPSSTNSVTNTSIPSTSEAHNNVPKESNESNTHEDTGTSYINSKNLPISQMQEVSSKILRLFLIDKQIEELMSEKMKIYSEIFSYQGMSQALFHSWAQDQIQQGSVMNVISNTSNVITELNKVINRNAQEMNTLDTSNSAAENTVEEAISELYTLKKEFGNSDSGTTVAQEIPVPSSEPNTSQPDNGFVAPTNVVVEENRPKLSVRKDLIDPNLSNINLLNTPVKVPAESDTSEGNCKNTVDDKSNIKKKKKKPKKKDSVEVINLIEDTDDEISSGTGVDSVATDDVSSKGFNSEDEAEKKDLICTKRISYDLDSKTVTCMTIMKYNKSKKFLFVGCKDGFVMGYAFGEPAISFTKKLHKDAITSVYYETKYLITGSADSTVCLFSLKEQIETQTLTVNAPVQSMDINLNQLIVGTKAGSIYTYAVKTESKKKRAFVSLHPNKKPLAITNSSILAVKLAKEGVRKVLIVASRGEQITVRDATSGLLLRTFDWCDTVYCLQLYEETPLVYCGTNTKSVKVVNYMDGENSGECIMGRSISQITFLHSLMFAASFDGNIYVYDVENKSLMATVIVSKGIILCLAVDSKSHVILVATNRGDLQQIPFPSSVVKQLKRLNIERKMKQQKKMEEQT